MRRPALPRSWAIWLGAAIVLLGTPAAQAAEADAATVKIGVAPFEGVAPPGAGVPDLATLLADRLGTRGVGRIVGPARLGAGSDSEPQDAEVKSWATQADVDAIVVGRTTRIGEQLSVDMQLRSSARSNWMPDCSRGTPRSTATSPPAGTTRSQWRGCASSRSCRC